MKFTGTTHLLDEPLIAPLGGQRCVVALTTYTTGQQNNRINTLTVVERLQTRRFLLESDSMRVVVEPSSVDLLFPARIEGRNSEIVVAEGQRVTVVGSVLRDGNERPTGDLAFRESRPTCMLVGGPSHPIAITA